MKWWFGAGGNWVASDECDGRIFYISNHLRIGSFGVSERELFLSEVIGDDLIEYSSGLSLSFDHVCYVERFAGLNLTEIGCALLEDEHGIESERLCLFHGCKNHCLKRKQICSLHQLQI